MFFKNDIIVILSFKGEIDFVNIEVKLDMIYVNKYLFKIKLCFYCF